MQTQTKQTSTPTAEITLPIEGMTCASCVGRVERALMDIPGVREVSVNLATERAHIRGTVDSDALVAAVAKAGYTARPVATGAGAGAGDDAAQE